MKQVFYRKNSWWGLVISAAIPVVNHFTGLGLEPEKVIAIMAPFIVWMFKEEEKEKE